MHTTTRDNRTTRRTALVAAAAALLIGACEVREADSHEQALAEVRGADAPADTPEVHAVAKVQRAMVASDEKFAGFTGVVLAVADSPDEGHVAEWIAALTRLEEALDADAIRALGDDPVLDEIAGPVDDLDASVQRILALLDPASGSPDLVGALEEAQAAAVEWQAAVPGIEAAWEDAVARWSAEWERAVGNWEEAWEQAVAEWEAAWAQAVAEWEAAWAQAAAEWEQAWLDAVAEWERQAAGD